MLGATDPDVTDEPMSHPQVSPQARNLLKHLREFESYISANASMIPNYGERRRYGEAVSTARSEEHMSELQSLMRISYAVFCLKKKTTQTIINIYNYQSCGTYNTNCQWTIMN